MRKFVSVMFALVVLLSGVVILTNPSAQESELGQIVFHSDRDGNNEIYIMDADGNNQRRLTNNGASDEQPTWSASGQEIPSSPNEMGTKKSTSWMPMGGNKLG